MPYILKKESYVDYKKFNELADACRLSLDNDVNNWLEFQNTTLDLREYEDEVTDEWFVLHVYDKDSEDPIPDFVHEKFASVIDILKSMKGVNRALFNLLGPNAIIHEHVDSDELPPYADTDIYNVVLGVFRADCKLEDIALEVEGTVLPTVVGEPVIFDGQVPHHGWNRSNEWRMTLFMFVDKGAFNEVC